MNNLDLYLLGIKAKNGDKIAMLDIINEKKNLIRKYSFNEDQYQYIILKLIEAIKRYNF